MTKKQQYTSPEIEQVFISAQEAVLNFASQTSATDALTIVAGTSIIGGTEEDGGAEW